MAIAGLFLKTACVFAVVASFAGATWWLYATVVRADWIGVGFGAAAIFYALAWGAGVIVSIAACVAYTAVSRTDQPAASSFVERPHEGTHQPTFSPVVHAPAVRLLTRRSPRVRAIGACRAL